MIRTCVADKRHIIPRWNSIDVANTLGETSPLCRVEQPQFILEETGHLQSLLYDWKLEKNLPLAIEIISSSRIINNGDIDISEVEQYARQHIEHMNDAPRLLREIIDLEAVDVPIIDGNNMDKVRQTIASLKHSLVKSPRVALNWCELARNYLVAGQLSKCERALHIAMSLAPNQRTVLRAVAHYYVHIGDIEKGLYYLRKSSIVSFDPWVLSSEIALSNEINKTSRFVKLGQRMIEDTNINPAALSELAGELGTMDFVSDNKRKGKKKIEIAKKAPHENSVAQMTWINQKVCKIENLISDMTEPKCNYEAEAKQVIEQRKWKNAVDIICQWQDYQPFSKMPALEGGFLAADFLNDPQRAINILEKGITSNPNDADLINNYVYSLIMAGDLPKATEWLIRLENCSTEEDDKIVLTATKGLLNYRVGNPDIGKAFYQEAIEQACKSNRTELEYRANIYFAREEKRMGNDISQQLSFLISGKNTACLQAEKSLIEKFALLQFASN